MNAPFSHRVLRSYQERAATWLYEHDAAFLIAPLGAGTLSSLPPSSSGALSEPCQRSAIRRRRTRLRGSSRPGMRRQHVTTHVCVAAATVDEMKRDRVIGKMCAQEAFKRHLERV